LQKIVSVIKLAGQLIYQVFGPGPLELFLTQSGEVIELNKGGIALHVIALLNLLLDLLAMKNLFDSECTLTLILPGALIDVCWRDLRFVHHKLGGEKVCVVRPSVEGLLARLQGRHSVYARDRL
jgi:hypothetical protein